jgi:hypothetical protein
MDVARAASLQSDERLKMHNDFWLTNTVLAVQGVLKLVKLIKTNLPTAMLLNDPRCVLFHIPSAPSQLRTAAGNCAKISVWMFVFYLMSCVY